MTQLSLIQILSMKEPPEDIDTLKEAFQLLSKIHHHQIIGWQRIQKNGLSVGPVYRDQQEAQADTLADWEIDTLRPVYDSPFNRLDLLIIDEASKILEQIPNHAQTLPDNWRWPISDELSGIAAHYSQHQNVLDSSPINWDKPLKTKDIKDLTNENTPSFSPATDEQIEAFTMPKDEDVLGVIIHLNEGAELPEYVDATTMVSKSIYTARITGKIFKDLLKDTAVKTLHKSHKMYSSDAD